MATPIPVPEPATSRIVRLTNVHFNANNQEIKDLFPDFEIESVFRTNNVKGNTTKKSVAYILFSTIAEKNQACNMSNLWIRDREIKVLPAAKGSNYELNDDGTAFISTKKTFDAAAGPADKSPNFNDTEFPALGTPKTPQGQKLPKVPMGVPEAGPSTADTQAEMQTSEADAELAEGTLSLSLEPKQDKEVIDVAPVETDVIAPESENGTALAVEGDEQSSHEGSPKEKSYPLFKAGDFVPPPPTTFDNYNLASNDANDPAKSFPTATGWYGFQADQFAKVEQEHREKGTNASRINNARAEDAEGDEDDDVLLAGDD